MEKQTVTTLPPPPTVEDLPDLQRLNFPEAMRHVIAGQKVTKLEWNDPDILVFHRDGYLMIQHANGRTDALIISSGDLLGGDWVVVP
jgi:hypothetical protein